MKRVDILEKLALLQYENKPVYNDKGNGTLKTIKKLNDSNLELYYSQFHDKEFRKEDPTFNIKSFGSYRSQVLNFLAYLQEKEIDIYEFSQKNLNDYFASYDSAGKLRTAKTVVEAFLSNLSIAVDFYETSEKIKLLSKVEKKAKALSSKEIEEIRGHFNNDKLSLFVFEWLYALKLSKEDFEKFSIDDFDYTNKTIKVKSKALKVSNYICDLINDDVVKKKLSRKASTFADYLNSMETELNDKKVIEGRFRPMDIKATTKMMAKKLGSYNYCPECGIPYESVADNWVIKQYENSDTKWIVCKACGKVDEN